MRGRRGLGRHGTARRLQDAEGASSGGRRQRGAGRCGRRRLGSCRAPLPLAAVVVVAGRVCTLWLGKQLVAAVEGPTAAAKSSSVAWRLTGAEAAGAGASRRVGAAVGEGRWERGRRGQVRGGQGCSNRMGVGAGRPRRGAEQGAVRRRLLVMCWWRIWMDWRWWLGRWAGGGSRRCGGRRWGRRALRSGCPAAGRAGGEGGRAFRV